MNALQHALLEKFPPPAKPYHPVAPTDFSRWQLQHEPPADLVWLYQVYGEGTFHVETGDSIRLMMPTARCVAAADLLWQSFHDAVRDEPLYADLLSVSRTWFLDGSRPEIISWGSSVNGLDLMSIWISDSIQWATVVFDSHPWDCICVFRSPACSLEDAVCGSSVFRGLFPWAEPPFAFIPDEAPSSAPPPQPSLPAFTTEEIQLRLQQSLAQVFGGDAGAESKA